MIDLTTYLILSIFINRAQRLSLTFEIEKIKLFTVAIPCDDETTECSSVMEIGSE